MKKSAGIAVAGICFALAAHGSVNVFDDAVFWFRGGKDISGDHCMQQGEFFDDLHANDASHDNHKMSMTSYTGSYVGFKDNAAFLEEQVVFPALGTSVVQNVQVLHISNAPKKKDKIPYYYPFVVSPHSVFARNNISNEYTIVSRIRMDEDDDDSREECLFGIGYNASAKQGVYLALAKSPGSATDIGSRYIKGKCTPNSEGTDTSFNFPIRIPTNTWVDLAVVVGNGKLRIGIAMPESSAKHDNNPTIFFAEKPMWTDNCSLLTDGYYRMFCRNVPSAPATSDSSDKTYFVGSIQQMAIWGRALSDQEVMAAFGMPRPAIFRTGFDNGNSNEFGGTRSDATQTIDGLGSWQNVYNKMQTGDEWTVNFDALRDEAGLSQIFSIKSLTNSVAALIEPVILDGETERSLGKRLVTANARVFWPVSRGLIKEGANTLLVKRIDNGAGDFLVDAMELGGSLGVGDDNHTIDDGRVMPALIASGIPSSADPNPQHWPQGLYPDQSNKNLRFRVWVDSNVVDKASSTFSTSTLMEADGNEFFTIVVNGENKGKLLAAEGWNDRELKFGPGVLKGGWNDIGFTYASNTSSTCHWLVGKYRFETVLPRPFSIPPPGMCVIVQ